MAPAVCPFAAGWLATAPLVSVSPPANRGLTGAGGCPQARAAALGMAWARGEPAPADGRQAVTDDSLHRARPRAWPPSPGTRPLLDSLVNPNRLGGKRKSPRR